MWFCIFLKEYYDYLFVYLDMGPGGYNNLEIYCKQEGD